MNQNETEVPRNTYAGILDPMQVAFSGFVFLLEIIEDLTTPLYYLVIS